MNNKRITLVSLVVTVIIILLLTGAMIFNTKNQLQMRGIQNLSNDIESLNAKVDDYYLKYGELPKLCDYTSNDAINFKNKTHFITSLNEKAQTHNARLNTEVNENDGDEYIVIDLEKLGNLTLTYGYDEEYKKVKNEGKVFNPPEGSDNDIIEDEIFVINTKTHQIYFPHGIFADNVMYYTF